MIQLFMSRSGSSAIVPLQFPASQSAIAEASRQLDEASREGKTKIVEIKSMIANLPSYLSRLDPDSRTQLAQLNRLSSIIAQMDSHERNIYAGALDGNSINDLNDVIRVAEQVSDYILIPNINSDVTLGRYVAVAGQIQGDPRFPEAAWPYLDFAKIGAEYYAEHGGAYTHAGYLLRKQDAEPVRENAEKIRLELSSTQAQVSVSLPALKEELERVKKLLGIDCFAEAAITRISFSVPNLNEYIPTTGVCVEDANELAWAIEGMQLEDRELMKYLSVLSVEQPETLQEALHYAMNLDDYEHFSDDLDAYGKAVLRRIGADDELINTIDGYMDFERMGEDATIFSGRRTTSTSGASSRAQSTRRASITSPSSRSRSGETSPSRSSATRWCSSSSTRSCKTCSGPCSSMARLLASTGEARSAPPSKCSTT